MPSSLRPRGRRGTAPEVRLVLTLPLLRQTDRQTEKRTAKADSSSGGLPRAPLRLAGVREVGYLTGVGSQPPKAQRGLGK